MDNLSLILYIVGLSGLCICIILIGTHFHKKNKFFSFLTLLFIFISVASLGFGTITKVLDNKKSTSEDVTDTKVESNIVNTSNESITDNIVAPSTEDLLFEYKIKNSQFHITITNNSSEIFNGNVHIKQLNESNVLSELDLPINNLSSKSTSTYTVNAESLSNLLQHEFNGSFSKEVIGSNPYSIQSVGVGNGYIRFQIASQGTDADSLQNICREFKNRYNINYCKGFLIYFIDSGNQGLDHSYADYFCNNEGSTSLLHIYNDDISININ